MSITDTVYNFVHTLIELNLIDRDDRVAIYDIYVEMLDFHIRAIERRK